MKPFSERNKIDITDVEDFNLVASDIFEGFLKTFTQENGLLRPVTEDDDHDSSEDGIQWVYTKRGIELAERMKSRLHAIGEAHYPHDDMYVNIDAGSYYQEM